MFDWFKWAGIVSSFLIAFSLIAAADDAGGDIYSNPAAVACSGIGLVKTTCDIMHTLLVLGPMIAIIALLLAGVIYVYAHVFVTADQRGRYHTLATGLAVAALILAAIVGGSGLIIKSGTEFLKTPTGG